LKNKVTIQVAQMTKSWNTVFKELTWLCLQGVGILPKPNNK
jgi:hypothetical protein